VANLFFENSTRTKFSFEVAANRLGAHVLSFNESNSSRTKGESLYDTLKTFESLGVDTAIIRHSDDHFIEKSKDQFKFSIVNAGAGKFQHPSQSLLDLFTIQEEFKTLTGLTITICGDINSSRVAKSNIELFTKMGISILLCGPEALLPEDKDLKDGCKRMLLKDAAVESDVLMFLRVQHERHEMFELETTDYNKEFGLNDEVLSLMKDDAIIMHPGPVNRDVEIASHLVEHPRSRIFKQMENGIYTRMAILDWLYKDGND
jgi:aspartate carbamoyltransferase catalytic subunit